MMMRTIHQHFYRRRKKNKMNQYSVNIGNSRVIESREVSDGAAIRRLKLQMASDLLRIGEGWKTEDLAVIKVVWKRVLLRNWRSRRSVGRNSLRSTKLIILRRLKTPLYALGESELRQNRLVIRVLDELERKKAQWSGVCSFCWRFLWV